jgi:hypothetical protein
MSEIINIVAREILDSRGNPAVEADVFLKSGVMEKAYRLQKRHLKNDFCSYPNSYSKKNSLAIN